MRTPQLQDALHEPTGESSRPPWLDQLGVSILSAAVNLARAMPERLPPALGRLTGQALYYALGPDFMDVRQHLRIAYRNELNDAQLCELARRFWAHLLQSAAEIALLAHWSPENLARHIDLSDASKLEPLRASGRGVIVASGHLGMWESGPYVFALQGYPIKLLHDPGTVAPFFDYVNRERARSGMEVLSKLTHPWKLKKLLDQGAWLCIACDLNNTRRGDQIPFFGTLASSYLSAAALQQISDCPIVVTSTARQQDGRHRFHVWEIIEANAAKKGRVAMRRTTHAIHLALEAAIRTYPEQWFWHYRRWRSRPVNENAPGPDGLPPQASGDWWASVDWDHYLKTEFIQSLPVDA